MRFTLALAFVLVSSAGHAYSVFCRGHNNTTNAYVSGRCNKGYFSGYDSRTNSPVYGQCQNGGRLSAYDSQTNEWVTGQCDWDPRYPRGRFTDDSQP